MITVDQKGLTKGNTLKIHTCETPEEAKAQGLPEGVTTYWELNGEIIYSPGEFTLKINQMILDGKLEIQQYLSEENIMRYHRAIQEHQSNKFIDAMKDQLNKCEAMPEPMRTQHKEAIQDQINKFNERMVLT